MSATSDISLLRGLVLALALMPHPKRLHAQVTAEEQAETEFRRGIEQRKSDPLGACERFRASAELYSNASNMGQVGECHERAGELRSALASYRAAASLNEKQNASRPARLAALRRSLEARIARILDNGKVVHLRVTPEPEGLQLFLDGELVVTDDLAAPQLVDHDGVHTLVARAPGYVEARVVGRGLLSVVLVPISPQTLGSMEPEPESIGELPPVIAPPVAEAQAVAEAQVTLPPNPRVVVVETPREPPARDAQRVVGYVTVAAGLGALIAAGYLGFRTRQLVDEAEPHCYPDGCEERGYDKLVDATQMQTAGFIVAGAGVVTVALGAAFVLTASSPTVSSGQPRSTDTTETMITARGTW